MLLRDASHNHHHHGVVTAWKDLYFPKGCGGPGPGTGAASGPEGVIGGQPVSAGTPGKQRSCKHCTWIQLSQCECHKLIQRWICGSQGGAVTCRIIWNMRHHSSMEHVTPKSRVEIKPHTFSLSHVSVVFLLRYF